MLRTYFDALDDDGSGSIDVTELEEVMVALGLAEKSSDVEKMVVDEDGSGEIEFHEFLRILRRGHQSSDPSSAAMFKVFKSLIRGDLGDTENIGFKLLTSAYRRKRIMDALMGKKESAQQFNNIRLITRLSLMNGRKLAAAHSISRESLS